MVFANFISGESCLLAIWIGIFCEFHPIGRATCFRLPLLGCDKSLFLSLLDLPPFLHFSTSALECSEHDGKTFVGEGRGEEGHDDYE
jgi:hypothetical protein